MMRRLSLPLDGSAVTALREAAGLSKAGLAEEMDVRRQVVQGYERSNPSLDLLRRVADVCGYELRLVAIRKIDAE